MNNRITACLNRAAILMVSAAGFGCHAAHAQQSVMDIVGIKPGMSVKAAMLALKADNSKLTLTPSSLTLEGIPGQVMPSVRGVGGNENIEIGFTVPPSEALVWGVKRTYSFAAGERPSLQNTLDALHKKYGAETVPPDPDPRNATKNVAWVYDAQGQPILGARGVQLNTMCSGLLMGNFGGEPQSTWNDIHGSQSRPAQCASLAIVSASVQATRDPASGQWVVFNLITGMADGARYQAGIDATRAVVLGAAKARANKQSDEVGKLGAPKL